MAKRVKVDPIYPRRTVYLDDRLWPAVSAIWCAAVATSVVIFVYCWRNHVQAIRLPWVLSGVIVAAAMLATWSVARTSPKRFRRGMALAVSLSLLANLAVGYGLSRIVLRAEQAAVQPLAKQPQPDHQQTFEEFYPMANDAGDDRPEQDFRKPVSTGEPDREQRDLVHKSIVRIDDDLRRQADAAPDLATAQEPMPLPRRQRAESAPRFFEGEGSFSRQMLEAKPVLGRPTIDIADVATQQSTPEVAASASETTLGRDLPQPTPALDVDSAPDSPVRPDAAALARARDVPEPMQVARVDSANRRARADVRLPRRPVEPLDSLEAPREVKVPSSLEDALAANPTEAVRRSTSPGHRDVPQPDLNDALVRVEPTDTARAASVAPERPHVAEPQEAVAVTERRPAAAPTVDRTMIELDRPAETPDLDATVVALDAARIERAEAARQEPFLMPAPEQSAVVPRPELERAGRSQLEVGLPGVAEHASEPAIDASAVAAGTDAEQLASPAQRIAMRRHQSARDAVEASRQASRRAMTRPSVAQPTPAAALGNLSPSRATEFARRGVDYSTEVVVDSDVVAMDEGIPNALSETGLARASSGGQPQTVASADAPLNSIPRPTMRSLSTLPAQPRRNLDIPSLEADQPSAAAVAGGIGVARRPSSAASPEIASDVTISGSPAATVTSDEPQLNRVAMREQRQPEFTATQSASQPRNATDAAQRPQASRVEVPRNSTQVAESGLESVTPVASTDPASPGDRVAMRQRSANRDTNELERVWSPNEGDEAPSPSDTPTAELPARVATTFQPIAPDDLAAEPDGVGYSNSASRTNINRPIPNVARPVDVTQPSSQVAGSPDANEVGPGRVALNAPTRQPRYASGGLVVDVDAHDGLGGLASQATPDVGSISRQAQTESTQVVDSVGRFIRRDVGGPRLSISTHVPIPASAYQTRLNRHGESPAGGNGRPSPRTEEAIELGLIYLANHQLSNGSWSLRNAGDPNFSADGSPRAEAVQIDSTTAATGLSLLSYLGAGYHHRSQKYGDEVQNGLRFLLKQQKPDGDLYVSGDDVANQSAWLYSHAIATIALCEAYGMTQDPELRQPAQQAIEFIVQAQEPRLGGWRYTPGVSSDTSVSGWMVMALRSGELANLKVPIETWRKVEQWLDAAQASSDRPERYRYNPWAENTPARRHGRRPTPTMTSVGLLMRLYTGWSRDDSNMVAGAQYLGERLPDIGDWQKPKRDTYYWYYATQVMFHMRGDYWEAWNNQLHPLLTESQVKSGPLIGSWDPWEPIPDRWAQYAGRLYVTTMNLLSLEVYYRHLPIYEDTAR